MVSYSELVAFLRSRSYKEEQEVRLPADFVVRGDTVTWWPITETAPYRFHYFGEELEKMERRDGEAWKALDEEPALLANEVVTEHGTLRPGDYIVHPYHGVGIFERREARPVLGEPRHFIVLRYADNDTLLFPDDRHRELMPYIGGKSPRLTRLNSKSWQKTKEKVEKDLIRVARELLKIYAVRQLTERSPYPPAPSFLSVVAGQAGFELTEDQARCWKEMQEDFAGERPMDRLICGDVGFGKTELALRAAAQVMAAGKQVAFIAPTTVLAEQHYALAVKRFRDLPVNVEHVSRLTAGRDKGALEQLAAGKVDLVIGTHRLLGKEIKFKDLGLLILDEEQKFGVDQKERLKRLRPHIDVLSLSATPIPRTLSLSLSGIRSLSILRTPPRGRLPVQTQIEPFTDEALSAALVREVERGGQSYVVYNRVQSLGIVRERVIERLAAAGYKPVRFEDGARRSTKGEGEVVVAMAHGQMNELKLAEAMSEFLGGEIDVLVASTIVEYGLDSPAANTLVVLHSEWFGLSDLYQLRGRVGRRQVQAYAHFLIGGVEREGYVEEGQEKLGVTETARKRLEALKEADTLGSGWSVALRDLEIRGGGNVLGHEQHGNLEAIGLLLYAQLLQEEMGRQAKRMGIDLFQKREVGD